MPVDSIKTALYPTPGLIPHRPTSQQTPLAMVCMNTNQCQCSFKLSILILTMEEMARMLTLKKIHPLRSIMILTTLQILNLLHTITFRQCFLSIITSCTSHYHWLMLDKMTLFRYHVVKLIQVYACHLHWVLFLESCGPAVCGQHNTRKQCIRNGITV